MVSDNAWRHFGFTWVGGVLRLFNNGIEDLSVAKPTDDSLVTWNETANDTYLGARFGMGNAPELALVGRLDEWALTNTALSPAQLLSINSTGKPEDLSQQPFYAANTISWLRLGDGDTFSTLIDQKGASNGTMINMTAGNFVNDVAP